jgi:hypothetical protein
MDLRASSPISSRAEALPGYGCADSQVRLWEYLDDELPTDESQAVAFHVAGCTECGPHAVFARKLLERIAAVRPEEGDLTALRNRIAGVFAAARLGVNDD